MKKFEIPRVEFIELETDRAANSGRDCCDDIGWGSCCYSG